MAAAEVTAGIGARIDVVWNVLTEGERFGQWPSGWTAVRGEIEDGARVALVGPGGTTRVRVEFGTGEGPGRSMRWTSGLPGPGRRRRDFALTEPSPGTTLLRVTDTAARDGQEGLQRLADAVRAEAERRAAL